MKRIVRILILFAAVSFPGPAFTQDVQSSPDTPATQPQERTVPGNFCVNDSRREIQAFCGNLTNLQNRINSATAKKEALKIEDLTQDFSQLDLNNPHSAEPLTKALAVPLAASTAESTALDSTQQFFQQNRLDKQLGAAGNASGTTSLISKAGSADLLSLALDTGALTRSVNGATSTLSTNADHLFRLITNHNPDCTLTFDNGCGSLGRFERYVLNPTNIVATFALAQQSASTTATSGQASGTTPIAVNNAAIPTGVGRLSSISARYEVRNRFDPRSHQFQDKLNTQIKSNKANLDEVTKKASASMNMVTDAQQAKAIPLDAMTKQKLLDAAKSNSSGTDLVNAFEEYYSGAVAALVKDQQFRNAVAQVTQYEMLYRTYWQQAITAAAGNLFTASYTYNKPLNQPYTHDITLIFARDFQDNGMLTFNGAVSLYDGALPAGAKYGRIHDGQISGEYDRKLTGKSGSTQTQLTLAGYWQYQPNPSILNIPAGTVAPGTTIPIPNGTQEFVGTAGSLWVAQAKFTIKATKGINIPLGVSWSNKTDLLQGSKVGAQVGISYDFSSFAGLFTGGGGQ